MTIRYTGLIAPEETPTGDGRMFAAGKGKTRPLPLTVMAKFESGGHTNALVIGKLVRTFAGPGGMWGSIDLLDPTQVPEVNKAAYMLDQRVLGPSVDLDRDFTVETVPHPLRVGQKAARFTDYNIVGVTLVPMPAFSQVHLSVDTKAEQSALLASAGVLADFDINHRAWDQWPIAPREYTFDADDAVKRIAAWSGIGTKAPSLEHYASTFLWRDGSQAGDTLAQDSFRLPLADIIDGQPHLIYHAVYAAAALLSGGHGGLPNIPHDEQERMKGVINAIYAKMAQQFGDSGMKSPFQGGGRQDSQASLLDEDCGCDEAVATEPALLAGAAPVAPPKEWFHDPHLPGLTRFTIGADGRVFGHLAAWRQCHVGIGDRCVMAPKSRTGYAYFKLGPVLTADGSMVDCGKITMGAAHAHAQYGVVPAREHYDNSAKCAAVVNVGEDRFGIWVAGALTAGLSAEQVAELRRSPLSGDWRAVDGQFELIAALAVNNPGFVVRDQDGTGFSMVGVGVVEQTETAQPADLTEFHVEMQEVSDDIDARAAQFDARLSALKTRQEALVAKKKADRLKEIDQRKKAQDETKESSIVARQFNTKFNVVKE